MSVFSRTAFFPDKKAPAAELEYQPRFSQGTEEELIIYKDNSETRFYTENVYLACKLHVKIDFS